MKLCMICNHEFKSKINAKTCSLACRAQATKNRRDRFRARNRDRLNAENLARYYKKHEENKAKQRLRGKLYCLEIRNDS